MNHLNHRRGGVREWQRTKGRAGALEAAGKRTKGEKPERTKITVLMQETVTLALPPEKKGRAGFH